MTRLINWSVVFLPTDEQVRWVNLPDIQDSVNRNLDYTIEIMSIFQTGICEDALNSMIPMIVSASEHPFQWKGHTVQPNTRIANSR